MEDQSKLFCFDIRFVSVDSVRGWIIYDRRPRELFNSLLRDVQLKRFRFPLAVIVL